MPPTAPARRVVPGGRVCGEQGRGGGSAALQQLRASVGDTGSGFVVLEVDPGQVLSWTLADFKRLS